MTAVVARTNSDTSGTIRKINPVFALKTPATNAAYTARDPNATETMTR